MDNQLEDWLGLNGRAAFKFDNVESKVIGSRVRNWIKSNKFWAERYNLFRFSSLLVEMFVLWE